MILLNVLKTFLALVFAIIYGLIVNNLEVTWMEALFIAVPFYFTGYTLYDYLSAQLTEAFNRGSES